MGIYDQLNQLDKVIPPPPQPVPNMTLNPEPEPAKASTPTKTATPKQESQQTRLPESQNARKPANKKASKQASQIASKPASQQARLPASQPEAWLVDLQPYLDLRATNKVSFRYPDTLIAWLEESLYKLKKAYGKKLTRNAILVAALAYALWDLEQHGQESFLYRQLIQEAEEA